MRRNLKTSFMERFWSRVEKTDSCWNWTGGKLTNGYGYLLGPSDGRKLAHRFVYEQLVGPIPEELQIDHLCRNRVCVNPEHLEPTTQRINILRGMSPTAVNAWKTECILGHPFAGANLYMRPDGGGRVCRTCHTLRRERYATRKR